MVHSPHTVSEQLRVLIVHAHHEPASFNSAMTKQAVATLIEAGHEVVVSDLYAMGFDPVSDRRNFSSVADPTRLRQQAEEVVAVAHNGFAPELQTEIDKLLWCDVLIFQFPIWWLGLPAILKGWVDRVFASGIAYGGGHWFDKGRLLGKRAMCSLTVGGPEPAYAGDGLYPPISQILLPIHHGIFSFCGFTVIEPFVVYGPNRISDEERGEELSRYSTRLLNLDAAPTLPMVRTDDYDGFVRRARA